MNEYEKLKRAMKDYQDRNGRLLMDARNARNDKEAEKRERRLNAISECIEIMVNAK